MDENNQDGFFNKPSFNAFERILCNHLIEAINSGPLQTIMHTMRAALALEPQNAKDLKVDQKQAKSLYTLAERIYVSQKITINENKDTYSLFTSTLDWKQDIEPWKTREHYSYSFHSNSTSQEWYDEIENSEDPRDIFDFSTSHLTESGFQSLCSDFLQYAITIAADFSRKIASKISPDTYNDMLSIYRGERKYEN